MVKPGTYAELGIGGTIAVFVLFVLLKCISRGWCCNIWQSEKPQQHPVTPILEDQSYIIATERPEAPETRHFPAPEDVNYEEMTSSTAGDPHHFSTRNLPQNAPEVPALYYAHEHTPPGQGQPYIIGRERSEAPETRSFHPPENVNYGEMTSSTVRYSHNFSTRNLRQNAREVPALYYSHEHTLPVANWKIPKPDEPLPDYD